MIIFHPPGRTLYALYKGSSSELQELIPYLTKGQKVRLISDLANYPQALTKAEKLKIDIPSLSVVEYQTIFYRHKIQDILEFHKQHPNTNWDNYSSEYQILQVDSVRDLSFPILEDFIIHSNGADFETDSKGKTIIRDNPERQAKISQTLKKHLDHSCNTGYLIYNPKTKQYAGCFILTRVGEAEIFWQYVSGKAKTVEVVKAKKMPFIAAAMFEIWEQEFPNREYLFFSNSDEKTKAVYQNLGFQPDPSQKCLILKQGLSQQDLQ